MVSALLSTNALALASCAFASYCIYSFVIAPFFLSSLRHLPRAHWSVPLPYFGSLWILSQRYSGRNNAVTAEAHLKHGPVVRLADNEISVNCYEGGIKTIYSGGWEKHEWYPRQFANFGVMNMFSTVGHHAHAQKKRIMANIYSKSFLQSSGQVESNSSDLLCQRFMPLLQSCAESSEDVEIHEINNAFTMDMMTAFQFGILNSTNFTQNVDVRRQYLHLYHSRRNWQFISSEVPPFVRKALQAIGVSLYPDFIHKANAWLEDWSRNMCDATDRHLKALEGASTTPGREPVVFKQYKDGLIKLRGKDPQGGYELHPHLDEGMNFTGGLTRKNSSAPDDHTTLLEVYSDMVDQLAAGHETSAIALTYFYYEICKAPSMQDRLREELLTLTPPIIWLSTSGDKPIPLPTAKDLDRLPFLNALLMETLRLHAPIPGMQPRITPSASGGVSLGTPGTKNHYTNIPANVRVSAMAYTLHKIPEVFTDPETFNPDRWLTSDEAQLREMNRHFWAFGSGGRMCIGSHFAIQEIKLITAAVFTNYRMEIVDCEGIEEVDAYTTRPTSGKFVVRLKRRE